MIKKSRLINSEGWKSRREKKELWKIFSPPSPASTFQGNETNSLFKSNKRCKKVWSRQCSRGTEWLNHFSSINVVWKWMQIIVIRIWKENCSPQSAKQCSVNTGFSRKTALRHTHRIWCKFFGTEYSFYCPTLNYFICVWGAAQKAIQDRSRTDWPFKISVGLIVDWKSVAFFGGPGIHITNFVL